MVAELQHLLDTDAGQPEHFDDRPGPEGVVLHAVEEPLPACDRISGPDVVRCGVGPMCANQRLADCGELLAGLSLAAGGQERLGFFAMLVGGAHQGWQDRQPLAGPSVHPGFSASGGLAPVEVVLAHWAGRDPRSPAGGVLQRPLRQVQIGGADRCQGVVVVEAFDGHLGPLPVVGRDLLGSGLQALFPCRRRSLVQAQRGDAGVVLLQVRRELLAR